jgi:hypothetical protein
MSTRSSWKQKTIFLNDYKDLNWDVRDVIRSIKLKFIRVYMVLGWPNNSAEVINEEREKKRTQDRSLGHTPQNKKETWQCPTSTNKMRPFSQIWPNETNGRRREIKETFKLVAQKIMINRIKGLGEIKKHHLYISCS